MSTVSREIVIHWERPPLQKNPETELEWLCSVLGLVGPRDHEKTTLRILREVISNTKQGKPTSLEELSQAFRLSKPSVLHHARKLVERGLIIPAMQQRRESLYELRMHSVEETIEEIEQDFLRAFQRIRKVGEEIDKDFQSH